MREGLWDPEFAKGGLNLREAQNQVNHLLQEIRMGKHDRCEVWAVTDNYIWSAVWNKRLSLARHLFDLVLTLKQEARKHEVYLHCFHILGDRMITSGVDGLLRGNSDAGILLGINIRQFLPMNVSAWDVAGNVFGRLVQKLDRKRLQPSADARGLVRTQASTRCSHLDSTSGGSISGFEGACKITSQASFSGYSCCYDSAVVVG
jgi:hypothetical protein